MSEETEDLWPETFGEAPGSSPLLILKQQAALLGKKTNHLVEASVHSQIQKEDVFSHTFVLRAPAIDYRYVLFRVSHEINLYPIFTTVTEGPLESEEELKEFLRDVFSRESTAKVINALITQSEIASVEEVPF